MVAADSLADYIAAGTSPNHWKASVALPINLVLLKSSPPHSFLTSPVCSFSPRAFSVLAIHSVDMQQLSSYVTPIPSMHIMLDCSPPSFSQDVAYNPSHLLYGGGDRYLPDGDDAPHQHGTIPPLTRVAFHIGYQFLTYPVFRYGHSMILAEVYHPTIFSTLKGLPRDCWHDQHFPSHLTRTSAIVPALGIHGTRDHAPDTLCQADDAADVEVSMPPYACPLPDV
ncbi:hypothetical protein BKA82DRAFT_32441 [Pisolithus tinctorius]|uniref:Uncharacterized protein n=1 Tax=Pisolithus tinctorius Marx 270 TaxID=870435 RepID=A0A0C3JID1_PISTI|nr:hypothetical protein BKA82DRAFT_32441 [Pisolithus tinctorius]KIN97336.1 hypothetical protein M404DRAFT_32441 [Pisolithus tinctorius Marx 270]